jgi:hypothetical protein
LEKRDNSFSISAVCSPVRSHLETWKLVKG